MVTQQHNHNDCAAPTQHQCIVMLRRMHCMWRRGGAPEPVPVSPETRDAAAAAAVRGPEEGGAWLGFDLP
eukprot:scaffold2878_cov390-Prasinococcus_capsulatus_cf.AAC.2